MLKKALYVLSGIVALALGIAGIALPVLPTTPFLLLTLYCFARGSKKLNRWFRGTTLYKKYLVDYVKTKSLTFRQKLSIQIFAGCMMIVSFIFINSWGLKTIVGFCFLIHNWLFITKIKTRKSPKPCMTKNVEVQHNGF